LVGVVDADLSIGVRCRVAEPGPACGGKRLGWGGAARMEMSRWNFGDFVA
jgi:hypothetical protein